MLFKYDIWRVLSVVHMNSFYFYILTYIHSYMNGEIMYGTENEVLQCVVRVDMLFYENTYMYIEEENWNEYLWVGQVIIRVLLLNSRWGLVNWIYDK